MILISLLLATVADSAVQSVVDALGEEDCPRLFAMLSPSFQQAVPASKWPSLCNAVGKTTNIEMVKDVAGMPTFHLTTSTGHWQLGLALDGTRVAGLSATPWTAAQQPLPPDPAVQPVVDALGEKDCPRLFAMLSTSFQQAVPASKWPSLCNGIGKATEVEKVKDVGGRPTYHLATLTGHWQLALVLDGARVAGLSVAPWSEPQHAKNLDEQLAQVGARAKIPGIAAMVLSGGKVTSTASWGVRKLGDPTPIGRDDRWHLGSDTKAMTATLAAIFVDAGKLSWTSTVSQVFPDWRDVDPAYAKATVETLLSHRAGMPSDIPQPIWGEMWEPADPAHERERAVHALLRLPPSGKVGAFQYANAGYMVVGVMLEKLGKDTWENLLKKEMFKPLGMTSCGFGPPASPGKVDQPWAHQANGGVLVAVPPGPDSDNPPSLGPAGTVHCSLADWGRFVAAHLKGSRGDPTGLAVKASTYAKLHEPRGGGDYALGWMVARPSWSTSPVLTHDGSNSLYYASVTAVPSSDLAFLVVANRGDAAGSGGVRDVMSYLIDTQSPVAAPKR